MRIGFFGTPELARSCLEGISEKHEILFVVSAEDKPAGRNKNLTICPVKDFACCYSIPVYHPLGLKDQGFIEKLKRYNVDVFVVVAFGYIIPREVFEIPPLKTINLHPSLLPRYRGAAPIEWAIINGEIKTGITVQLINERLDAGDILLQRDIDIPPDMDAGELHDIVKKTGPEMIHEALTGLADGSVVPVPQDDNEATYCGKIDTKMLIINWSDSHKSIHNLVRGVSPQRGARSSFRDKNIKIFKTALTGSIDGLPDLSPGELYVYQKKRLIAGTGEQPLEIKSIQPEGKKVMDALPFINGHRIAPGDSFK